MCTRGVTATTHGAWRVGLTAPWLARVLWQRDCQARDRGAARLVIILCHVGCAVWRGGGCGGGRQGGCPPPAAHPRVLCASRTILVHCR